MISKSMIFVKELAIKIVVIFGGGFFILLCLSALNYQPPGEQEYLDSVSQYQVNESGPMLAKVVKIGETLPRTGLTKITVRLRERVFMNVLSDKKLSVGQEVEIIRVYFQASDTLQESFRVLVVKE